MFFLGFFLFKFTDKFRNFPLKDEETLKLNFAKNSRENYFLNTSERILCVCFSIILHYSIKLFFATKSVKFAIRNNITY